MERNHWQADRFFVLTTTCGIMTSISTSINITLSDGNITPWLAWGNGSGKARKDPLASGKLALSLGVKHLDTAQGFGPFHILDEAHNPPFRYNNEELVAETIAGANLTPSDIFVTSKSTFTSAFTPTALMI